MLSTLLLSLALAADDRQPDDGPAPVIALITIDTLRADHVGCYGNAAAATPAIDALARTGLVFERAYTVAPVTLVAHASLLTGELPPRHGVHDNGLFRLAPGTRTLAGILGEHGYLTAAFVSAFVLDRSFGLDQGFARYDDEFQVMFGGVMGLDERNARDTTDAALAWLAKAPLDRPLFLWVHYYDPHAPYAPPPPFDARFAAHPYDGEIAFVDSELARLVAALERRSAKRAILVTADHGEALGDHGERTHGLFVYESAARIPLIMNVPGGPLGERSPAWVSLIDVLPTVLELAHVPADGHLPGESLLTTARTPRPLYLESFLPKHTFGWAPLRAIIDPPLKLIAAPKPELYDLERDPGERNNLLAGEAEAAARLRAELDALAPAGEGAPSHDLSAEDRDKLRRLGYGAARADTAPDPKDRVDAMRIVDEAEAKHAQQDVEGAAQLYRQALARDPENPYVLERLGSAVLALGSADEAVTLLEHAQRLRPISGAQRYQLALAYQKQGKLEQAAAQMEALARENPRFAPASIWLARKSEREGHVDDAIRRYRDVIEHWHGEPAVAEILRAKVKELEGK